MAKARTVTNVTGYELTLTAAEAVALRALLECVSGQPTSRDCMRTPRGIADDIVAALDGQGVDCGISPYELDGSEYLISGDILVQEV